MHNTSISLVSLDFDTMKASLKSYMKSQNKFKDYDFDGSNMSVLLDVLAFNTYHNAFYLNMAVNESFLDSAQIRDSVVSKAKELNYTPRSRKSSSATLDLAFPQSGLDNFTIPALTKFSGQNANNTYTFVTGESMVLYPSAGLFTIKGLSIYEGRYLDESFVFDSTIERQRFLLSNQHIDTDSLTVTVIENHGANVEEFSPATSLFNVNSTSKTFFVQGAENNQYEIVFGDNVFGRKPLDSSIIVATYRVTSGADGDGATNFSLDDDLGAPNGIGSAIIPTVSTASASFGGAERETIESIRFNAPRHYETQEMAITVNDYRNLVLNNFTRVKTVHIYGGERVTDSVKFGKVFVVPLTYSGSLMTAAERATIQKFLNARSTIGISCLVVDPDILYVMVNTIVNYDKKSTSKTASDIEAIVKAAIITYNQDKLTNFDLHFEKSTFTRAIDNADPAIISNSTTLRLKKNIQTTLNEISYIDVLFNNEIVPGTILSSNFASGGRKYKYTDYNPNINNFYFVQEKTKTVIKSIVDAIYLVDITNSGQYTYKLAGTVNYETGQLLLNPITVDNYLDAGGVEFYATPSSDDLHSRNSDLLTIDTIAGINIDINFD